MDVDEHSTPQSAQPDQVGRVSAPSPVGWHFVRLTDTPIHILAIYLFMTLVLPPFLLAINDVWPIYYHYQDFSVFEGILVISAVVFACLFRHFQWAQTREIAVTPRAILFYSNQKLRIAGLLFAIVVAIINSANSGFRYDAIGLSERGSFSLYVYVIIQPCVTLLLIYHAFVYRGTSAMDRLECALITMALAASINGNATAWLTVFSFVVLQFNARAFLFKSKFGAASNLSLRDYLRLTVIVGVVGILLTGAYIYGESVKRQESVISVFESLTGTSSVDVWTSNVLIERLSPPYASLVNTLPLTFDFDRDNFGNLVGVWNTFLFRLEALDIFRFGVDRGNALSIMRLNYEFIDIFGTNLREGTAPGLISGFLYSFPPILNVLMLGAYVFMMLGILQRLCLCMNEEMSFIGKFILTYFTLPLFSSPIDLLMIIDDALVFVVGLWWMGRLVEPIRVEYSIQHFRQLGRPEPDTR